MTSIISNFSINLEDKDVLDNIKHLAHVNNKTFSRYIVDVLKDHVKELKICPKS